MESGGKMMEMESINGYTSVGALLAGEQDVIVSKVFAHGVEICNWYATGRMEIESLSRMPSIVSYLNWVYRIAVSRRAIPAIENISESEKRDLWNDCRTVFPDIKTVSELKRYCIAVHNITEILRNKLTHDQIYPNDTK